MRLVPLIGSAMVLVIGGAVAGYIVNGQLSRGATAQADVGLSTVYPVNPFALHDPDQFSVYAQRESLTSDLAAMIEADLRIPPGASPIRFAFAPTSGLPGEQPSAIRVSVTGENIDDIQSRTLVLAQFASEQMAVFAATGAIQAIRSNAQDLVAIARSGIPPYLSAIRENENKQAILADSITSAASPTSSGTPGVEVQVTDPRFYPPEQQIVALRNDRADQLAIVSQMRTNLRTAAIQLARTDAFVELVEAKGSAAFPEINAEFEDIVGADIDNGVALAPFVNALREADRILEAPEPVVSVRTASSTSILTILLGAFAGAVIWLCGWQVARFRR
jgi:hypothetical protein